MQLFFRWYNTFKIQEEVLCIYKIRSFEDCNNYVFGKDTYDKKKEEVFGLLYQAKELKDSQLQKQILSFLDTVLFGRTFLLQRGMFFFDDIYREKGRDGIIQYIQKGSKNFVRHIFEE